MALELGEELKDHKSLYIILAVVAVIAFYLLSRRGSTSSGSANNLVAFQSQQNQLEAQLQAQNNQTSVAAAQSEAQLQAQNEAAAMSASVQNNQTNAALLSSLFTAKEGANVQNNLTAAQLAATNAMYNSQNTQAGLQAGVYNNAITAQETAMQLQAQQNGKILDEVGEAGLNHGTTSLENTLAGIIAETEGQPSAAQSYANANAVGSESSAFQTASIWNSISNMGKTAISAVLA